MYYDVIVTETTIYNDGRKAKQVIETANSFNHKGSAYAYLDGIQEWNEEEIKASVNIDGRSFSDFDRSINSLIFTLPLTTRAIKK